MQSEEKRLTKTALCPTGGHYYEGVPSGRVRMIDSVGDNC